MVERTRPSSKVIALACGLWAAAGCKSEAPDVLREFPPPRLAKLAPNVAREPLTLTADCTGDLALRTRTKVTSLPVRQASGSFTVAGGTRAGFDATLSVALPPEVSGGNTSTSQLTWRVLEVRPANEGQRSLAGGVYGTSGSQSPTPSSVAVVAQVEYNRVRTQAVHSLVFEAEDPGAAPSKVHLLRLAVDPNSHHLRFPVDPSTPTEGRPASWATGTVRRVELNLHCELTETDSSPP